MPIKFSFKKLPVDADGKAYNTLEEFQAAEIKKLVPSLTIEQANCIVEQQEWVIEALEINLDSRPGARGVSKKRKPKATEPAPAAEPAPASEPTPAPQ